MRPRSSDYASHLRAKQKMRRYYGMLERQFRNCYRKSANAKGDTGTNLVQMLERRLDNVVYRMGFACTRAEARQLVSHKLIEVDGKVVNIPSYHVSNHQKIAVRAKARAHGRILQAMSISDRVVNEVPWVSVDASTFAGEMIADPDKGALGIFFDEGMVVEYYSK